MKRALGQRSQMKRHADGIAPVSRCTILTLMVLLRALAMSAGSASADDAGQAQILEKGQTIAAANCTPCHAIGHIDPPPVRTNKLTSFRDLHKRFPVPMLIEAVKSGSIEGHDEMPAFDFAPEEMAALLAYIDSFSPNEKQKYLPNRPQ